MGGGLAFLSKKFFNPANLSNQRRVWLEEQRAEKEAKAARERAEQLKRERDDEELAKARGGRAGGDRAALSFMYAVPPGMANEKKEDGVAGGGDFGLQGSEDVGSLHVDVDDRKPAAAAAASHPPGAGDITQRRPGDDDAAAAFRAMLAGHQRAVDDADQDTLQSTGPSNALIGSEYDPSATPKPSAPGGASGGDNRTQLEKAVGRRDAYHTSLTLEEQVARFPSLKNAPMAPGMKADNVNVSFKPLGAEIRNVRCLKCGVWGHSRGDRECKLGGWNPFELGSDLVPVGNAATQGAAPRPAAAPNDAQARSAGEMRPGDGKRPSSSTGSRKRTYSSESDLGSNSGIDTDSSEEGRRRRRRKKGERRKRSKKSSRSRHKSRRRHRDDDDDRRHPRKKSRHGRDHKESRRRDGHYSSMS
jgi:CBF1 interacting corepressor